MKARAIKTSLETFGVETTTQFSIKATAKAFRALIDGIYSDKIGTPVRELVSNAWDSHIEAGQTRRFLVHAPTKVHPEFFVRDYGVGMSHEKIETVYSTLFASDKDDTNLMVGQKGLGSKSPFAFTDAFYVHAYDDEVVRHYQAVIGQNGIPQILYCGCEASTEPRGIQVGFAVPEEHHAAFVQAVRYTALGIQPTFKSNIKVVGLDDLPLSYKGADYWAIPHKHFPLHAYKENFWVRQGCVLYAIDEDKIQHVPSERWGDCWVLDMPIGTVDVTESREAIQYSPETKAAIEARLVKLREQVRADAFERAKDIKNVTDYFDAMRKMPHWVDAHDIPHPATGLVAPIIPLIGGRCYFYVQIGEHERIYDDRPRVHTHNNQHTYYVIRDASQVIDHGQVEDELEQKVLQITGEGRSLEVGERRRLIRIVKGYMGRHELDKAEFLFGVDWPKDFWKKTFPNVKVIETTIAEMNECLPFAKRFKLEKPQKIHGLSLVTHTVSDHGYSSYGRKEITALPADLTGAAYVLTGEWRAKGEHYLYKTGFPLGCTTLMVAYSKAPQYLTDAGVKTLGEFLVDRGALVGLNRRQLVRHVLSYMAAPDAYRKLFWTLDSSAPEQFERVRKSVGPLGRLCREIAPVFELRRRGFDLSKLKNDDLSRLLNLILPYGGKDAEPLPVANWLSARFGVFSSVISAIAEGIGNEKCTTRLPERITALLAVQSTFRAAFKRNPLCRPKSPRPSPTRKSPSSSTAASVPSPVRLTKARA